MRLLVHLKPLAGRMSADKLLGLGLTAWQQLLGNTTRVISQRAASNIPR